MATYSCCEFTLTNHLSCSSNYQFVTQTHFNQSRKKASLLAEVSHVRDLCQRGKKKAIMSPLHAKKICVSNCIVLLTQSHLVLHVLWFDKVDNRKMTDLEPSRAILARNMHRHNSGGNDYCQTVGEPSYSYLKNDEMKVVSTTMKTTNNVLKNANRKFKKIQ